MARQFSTGTKFGSEKGKVQNPARIPPQTPPAGGKKAEAGQFHSPRKIVCPAESKLVFRIFVKKSSNINQKTPPDKIEALEMPIILANGCVKRSHSRIATSEARRQCLRETLRILLPPQKDYVGFPHSCFLFIMVELNNDR